MAGSRSRWLRRLFFLGGVLVLVVLLRFTVFRSKAVPVTVTEARRGRVEETVVNSRAGTVESRRRAQMSPGIAGLVADIPAKKGESVRAGQVLLRLDDSEYRAQVALADRQLDAARANADQACLSAEQAARDRLRAEDLGRQGLIATQALETARLKAETADAGCAASRQQIKQAQASLDLAHATEAKTVMSAPFDGIVLNVTTEVGEWISPSPPGVFIPPVIDLIDPHALYVSAPIDEADAGRIRVGLPVRITLDAFRGRSFPGTLSYVSSYVQTQQEQNRTLAVEATFDQAELPPNLLPGLSADLEIILGGHDGVLRIPSYALTEGNRVLVVRGGRLVSVQVAVGLHNYEFTEVDSGLAAGDRVVVSLDRPEVKAGARARITGEQEK